MKDPIFKREKEQDEQLNIRIPKRIARKIEYKAYTSNSTKKAVVSYILEEATSDWPEPNIIIEESST